MGGNFHETDNPNLICYSKTSPERSNAIIIVVDLDWAHAQSGWVTLDFLRSSWSLEGLSQPRMCWGRTTICNLLTEGTHYRSFEKLGAHLVEGGAHFAVWAPNAESASVIGDFNNWTPRVKAMKLRPEAGVWELFVPGAHRHYSCGAGAIRERQCCCCTSHRKISSITVPCPAADRSLRHIF